MRAVDRDIREFLTANNNYIIPVYQRNYDWGKVNCEKLISDIIISEQEKRQEYFLGSFVTVQKSPTSLTDFYIIDGQQRLTSLTLLLLAIYNVSDETLKKAMIPFIFTNSSGDKRLILKQIQKDEINLSKILKNEELYPDNSNIINNYLFFRNYILEKQKDIALIIGGLNRLRFVHIQLQPHDHPQLVFETLNATGKELSEADKIRNFILMYEEQEHLYQNYWVKIEENCQQNLNPNNVSGLMKAFLTIEYRDEGLKPIKDDSVYEVFKGYHSKNSDNKAILDLMKQYSDCYHKILAPEPYGNSLKYMSSLKNIKELDQSVINPLLLCILKLEQDRVISTEDAAYLIELLENYLVRRRLADTPSNALNKVAFALINKIKKGPNSIKGIFEQTLLGFNGSARFPKDEEVINNLKTKALYKNRVLIQFVLKRLECFYSKEQNNYDAVSIEHIMPQKLTPEWKQSLGSNYLEIYDTLLHTIGNVTYTGYNPELSNKTFQEKLPTLRESKFRFLNKEFTTEPSLSTWGKNEISDRTERLASKIINIYPYPDIKTVYQTIDISDDEDFSYKQIIAFEFNSKRYDLPECTWAAFTIELCKLLYAEDPIRFNSSIMDNPSFENKISIRPRNSWAPMILDAKTMYINTVTDTNSKIKMLNTMIECLDLQDIPISLYINSSD